MSLGYLHLVLNHVPIVGAFMVWLVLLYGFLAKKTDVQVVALYLLVFVAVLTLPVMKTGDEAEELIENVAGISHAAIHAH